MCKKWLSGYMETLVCGMWNVGKWGVKTWGVEVSNRIVLITGTVNSRLRGFSLTTMGVQFNPSMSRTHKATHRTRFEVPFLLLSLRLFTPVF